MRRYLLTLFAALAMLLSIGGTALAEETDPEPVVVDVYTETYQDPETCHTIQRMVTVYDTGAVAYSNRVDLDAVPTSFPSFGAYLAFLRTYEPPTCDTTPGGNYDFGAGRWEPSASRGFR